VGSGHFGQNFGIIAANDVAEFPCDVVKRGFTVVFWSYNVNVWVMRVFSYTGNDINFWSADVTPSTVTTPSIFSGFVSWASGVTISAPFGNAISIDDVMVLPRALTGISNDVLYPWLKSMAASTVPYGPSPRVRINGPLIDPGLNVVFPTSLLVHGTTDKANVRLVQRGGVVSKAEHELMVSLEEI
jgi:hypothetical protein